MVKRTALPSRKSWWTRLVVLFRTDGHTPVDALNETAARNGLRGIDVSGIVGATGSVCSAGKDLAWISPREVLKESTMLRKHTMP